MRLLLVTLFTFLGIISNISVLGYNYGFRRGLGYGRFNPPPEVAVDLGSIQNRKPKVNSNPNPYLRPRVSVFSNKGSSNPNLRISNSAIEESFGDDDPNEKLSENLPTTSGMNKMVQGRNIPLMKFIRRITLYKYNSYTRPYIWLFWKYTIILFT